MPKGPEKNTKNKALHTKLLNRKKAKLQEEKKEKAARLKALVAKMNQKKNTDDSNQLLKSIKSKLTSHCYFDRFSNKNDYIITF